ncbi:hypothetical protein DH2020_012823 [Rehmannia glutinosa]|uniref:R2R3-MYB protein n=1 Tax=Rehmannia glutinosa TaxID=99300 RepID=A0ABR0X3X0_REHGL
MSMTSESDEMMMPKNDIDSPPAADDANSGGSVGGNNPLKKGPWTSAEDAILSDYVTKHGEGNWNAVQKHSGLDRCGKSCRLRWANHLRPDLKKGAFSPEEEQLIIELHAKMGNKWARMAAELPGRTDNEIKNYWNTRIKRRQRAGLPIYPPDICSQPLNENQQTDDMTTFSSGDVLYPDFMPVNNFKAPDFKIFGLTHQFYQPTLHDIPATSLLDIPTSNLLAQNLHSYPNKTLLSNMHPVKRLRGSESFFPGPNGNAIPNRNQYSNDSSSAQIAQSFICSSPYDHNYHNSTSNQVSSSSLFPAVLIGNPSSSEPGWAMKLELPSLQTQAGSWGPPSSPLPSLESVDTFIQNLPTEHNLSCNLLPQNSGLLDAVLYESQTIKNSKETSYASNMVVDITDTASQDLHETEWEAYGRTISHLGHSSSSVFSEGTPVSANSFDESEFLEPIQGCNVKEPTTLHPIQYDDKVETADEMVFTRPDLWLVSDCFGPMKDPIRDQSLLKDIGTLLCDDLGRDCKKMDTSTSSSQSHGHDSCTWNAMSTV